MKRPHQPGVGGADPGEHGVKTRVPFGVDAPNWSQDARIYGWRCRPAVRLLPQCDAAENDAAAACRRGVRALGTVRKIERGVTDATLEAIAHALGVDPGRLCTDRGAVNTRVPDALPALSAAIATYDAPEDGTVRPMHELRTAVADAARWRVAAQYTRIVRAVPELLIELSRAYHTAPAEERAELAGLLVQAYRSADAVAYKFGAWDLDGVLIGCDRGASVSVDPGASLRPRSDCVDSAVRTIMRRWTWTIGRCSRTQSGSDGATFPARRLGR